MKIITLTLNPAYDIHCYTENFKPFRENLAQITSNDVGGKGINISRALTENGIDNTAFLIVGDQNCEHFLKNLEKEKIKYESLVVPGRIRENITLHTKDMPETRISFSGFDINKEAINKVKDYILKQDLKDTIVTFSGRVPNGVDIFCIKELLVEIKLRQGKVVLDSRSFSRTDIIDISPWLIKPNEEEICMYTDILVNDINSASKAAESLRNKGIENVMISLGDKGAVLCCKDGIFVQEAHKIDAVSTIGAGDSSIAGFIAAISENLDYQTALKYSVAYGTAACLESGTKPPTPENIKMFL